MGNESNWLKFFEDRERLHANYYLDFAQQHARRDPEAYEQLEAESGNLLKIATWLSEQNEAEGILQLAEALWQKSDFMRSRGFMQRGLPLLEWAREVAHRLGDQEAEFNCLEALAHAHYYSTNHRLASILYKEMLGLAHEIGDPRLTAQAYFGMGRFQMYMGQLNQAKTYSEQALYFYHEIKDIDGEINVRTVLGEILSLQGDFIGARACLEQGLPLAQALPARRGEILIRFVLGYTAALAEKWTQAIAHFKLVTNLARATGDRYFEARSLLNQGEALLALGDSDQAIKLLEAALGSQAASDDILTQAMVRFYLAKAYNVTNQFERSLEQLTDIGSLRQAPLEAGIVAEAERIRADNYMKLRKPNLARPLS